MEYCKHTWTLLKLLDTIINIPWIQKKMRFSLEHNTILVTQTLPSISFIYKPKLVMLEVHNADVDIKDCSVGKVDQIDYLT